MENFDREQFNRDLEEGWQYQDFLSQELLKYGIVLMTLQSRQYQKVGDNLLGIEIKYDRSFSKTGNIFLECEQHKESVGWTKSGIFEPDQSWLYGIGDFNQFYIFGKKCLQRLVRQAQRAGVPGCSSILTVGNGRARGVTMTKTLAENCAEKIFYFKQGES